MMDKKRVLVACDDLPLCRHVSAMGARHVVAVAEREPAEPWPESVTPGLELAPMTVSSLGFADGAFDVAVVPDLAALGDCRTALSEIRRVVGDKGYAFIASPNPACGVRLGPEAGGSPLDYYALYDLLAGFFPSVQMVGQSPFVGYAVADLSPGEEEVDVQFDSSLLEDANEEIEWFLAICGHAPAPCDPYAVIQIPIREAALGNAGQAERLERELAEARKEIGNRGVRIGTLEKDLENELMQSEKARERAVQVTKELEEERRKSQKKNLEEEYQKRTVDLDLQARVKELTLELKRSEERANVAEVGRDDMLVHMRADVAELDRLRDRIERAEEDAAKFAEKERSLAAEIDRLKAALQTASEQAGDKQAEEISALEALLKAKGNALAEAESEIARREAIVRDLVVELERRQLALGSGDDEPNRKIAELEGKLQAAAWRVAEMEARNADLVRIAGESDAREGPLKEQLAAEREAVQKQLEAAQRGARMFEDEASRNAVRAAGLATDLETARGRIGELETQLSDAAEKQHRLENQLGEVAKRADSAEALAGEAEASQREAAERYAELLGRLEAATAELEGARAQIGSIGAAREDAEEALRRQIADARNEAGGLASELEALKSRLADTEERFAGELTRGASVLSTVDSLSTALDGAQNRVKMLEGEIDRSNENVASYEKEINELGREKDEALRQLKQAEALGDSLEKKLEEMRKTVDGARADRDRASKRAEELEKALKERPAAKQDTQPLEALLESLTAQLEEREQRATRLERQVRELDGQIKDHESDIVAWEMELKFRNTRISQLETEVAELQQKIEAQALRPAPRKGPGDLDGAGAPVWSASKDDDPEALRVKLGQLNEALGDKDAEILILHGQMEDADRRLQISRHALEELLKAARLESAVANQLKNLLKSMQ